MAPVLLELMFEGNKSFREQYSSVMMCVCDVDCSFLPLDSQTLELFKSLIPFTYDHNDFDGCGVPALANCMEYFVDNMDLQLLARSQIIKTFMRIKRNEVVRCFCEIIQTAISKERKPLLEHLAEVGVLTFLVKSYTDKRWNEEDRQYFHYIVNDLTRALERLVHFDPEFGEILSNLKLPRGLKGILFPRKRAPKRRHCSGMDERSEDEEF
jgi:hypothetical protein